MDFWQNDFYLSIFNQMINCTEKMFYKELFFIDLMHPGNKKKDLMDVVSAFKKVWMNRNSIKKGN